MTDRYVEIAEGQWGGDGRSHKTERRREERRNRAIHRQPPVTRGTTLAQALAEAGSEQAQEVVVVSARKVARDTDAVGFSVYFLGYTESTTADLDYRGWTKAEWDAIQKAVQDGRYAVIARPEGDFLEVDLRQ